MEKKKNKFVKFEMDGSEICKINFIFPIIGISKEPKIVKNSLKIPSKKQPKN